MISQTAEYALRAVVDLAYHHGESRTTLQISKATHVPADYLAKILQDLNRKELVRSQRGPGGGFTLMRSPESITVFDVLEAVDPVQRIRTCPLGLKEHKSRLCPLHRRLDEAMSRVEQAFRETSITEVTAEKARVSKTARTPLTISGGLAARK